MYFATGRLDLRTYEQSTCRRADVFDVIISRAASLLPGGDQASRLIEVAAGEDELMQLESQSYGTVGCSLQDV